MVFGYLLIARTPHRHIIIVARATFNNLIIGNTKSIITGAERYLIIKKTSFTLGKKFAIISNRRKYYGYNKQKKYPQH